MPRRPLLAFAVLLVPLLCAGTCRRTAPKPAPESPEAAAAPRPTPLPPAKPAEPPASGARSEAFDRFPKEAVESTPLADSTVDELNRRRVLRPIYFEYDRSDLGEEARRILQENATWLRSNPGRSIVVEGHCDERGTVEYNLALGQRRAASVRDYLESLGIGRGRMRVVSFGKERPAVPGAGEAAWSKNRRAEFVIES